VAPVVAQPWGYLPPIATISSGQYHTCALTGDGWGWVFCWGKNDYGQLGTGSSAAFEASPVQTLPEEPGSMTRGAVQVAAGRYHTCAMWHDAEHVVCWGLNNFGQLGNGTTEDSPEPYLVNFWGWRQP
jgi:alpha-tubulin suppressor-like RCC1 family protein